jgi:predicted porin
MEITMRKILLGTVLMSACIAAHAQSSVTLYGRLDAGIDYMSGLPNGSYTGSTSRWRVESGDWSTTKWGLRGVEDLGGGTRVVFNLEGKFNTNTGTSGVAGSVWDRKAFVGLANDQFGTLLLGRQLFISNGVWDLDPFGQTLWSSASMVRGRNWPHTSNDVSYQSQKFGGLDVYGQYSLSDSTSWNSDGNGQSAQGRQDGLQVTYTTALFQFRGLYDEVRDPTNGLLDNVFTASREYTAGMNVFLGPVRLSAVYQASRTSGIAGGTAGTPTTTNHEWGGFTWQVTPAASLIGAVYHVNANNGAGNATLYTIGGAYGLSKSTFLDFQIASVHNSKTANFGLDANAAGPGGNTPAGYDENPLYGHGQSGAYVGIQHMF